MISFDEAVERVQAAAAPLGVETVSLESAIGRVVASPITAGIDSPRNDVSAMDGYAVREQDLASFPVSLRVVGEAFAGAGWSGTVIAGTCARIFTGAPVPAGADRVVIQENVERDEGIAHIRQHPGAARHIRKRGGDFRAGTRLLEPACLLNRRTIVAAAGADVARVEVYSAPRVTLLSTGDELAEPGSASSRPDAIPESVSYGIAALVDAWGGAVIDRQRLPDDLATMEKAASVACIHSDLIIVTGGASVGEKDFAKTMFEPMGLELIFAKVAIKPGKPVWLGRTGKTLVMGLPGNPTSALVTARLFLAPLLCRLTGRPGGAALRWRKLPLAAPLEACGPRETFHRAFDSPAGVQLLGNQDSSAQHALAQADLLVRQRAHAPALAAGSMVDTLDF